MYSFSLTLVFSFLACGCTSAVRRPEPTTSYIPMSEVKTAQGPQVYNLSPRERRRCEKRAASGDVVAAKTLVEYHEMITRDEKQYQYWLKVVARLEKAQRR